MQRKGSDHLDLDVQLAHDPGVAFAPEPARVVRLRAINLPVFLVWCVLAGIALLYQMTPPLAVKICLAAVSLYLYGIGIVMTLVTADY